MLILNQEDLWRVVSRNEVVDSVEQALLLYESRDFHMPDRMHVDHRGNTLLLMPCFTEKSMGTKLVSLFPENSEQDIPVLFGVMVLNDGETGKPLALLDGAALTALRTGAVGSVSIRHMTSKKVKNLGVVGAGVQGFHQILTACTQRDFKTIYVYDMVSEKAERLRQILTDHVQGIDVKTARNSEELLKESEVVITATTSTKPVLPDQKGLFQGKHIVGIGSYKPDMREFPQALFQSLKIMTVDTEHALEESGDLKVPLEKGWIQKQQIMTLGKVISGKATLKPEGERATVFKSVGMALFDLVVSEYIYKKANQKGIGREVDF
ncbi:MAG: ornithine cyclodeaminase family protein [Candidatus Aminicenantes bacterium]|nr:ornithine cyclodeaminase family protein [Candidatus Aminicenantes bacterium]